MYIVPTILTELLYPLQYSDTSPLLLAAKRGHNTCVEHLLSAPGIDVNIKDRVSLSTACLLNSLNGTDSVCSHVAPAHSSSKVFAQIPPLLMNTPRLFLAIYRCVWICSTTCMCACL